MTIIAFALTFLILLAIGIPIAFCLGLISLELMFFADGTTLFTVIAQRLYGGIDSFLLLAIPLFILAGRLMNESGMTSALIRFCDAFIGRLRGGLGLVNVMVSMVFAGVSGSAVADTSAVGTILIPEMREKGYDPDFSAAVTAASSGVGPIIPPSVPMIVFAHITETSVAALFLAGMIPGILLGILQMILVYAISLKRDYPKQPRVSFFEFIIRSKDAILALAMPVIILGGIFGGIFTATEASAVAVFYALTVGLFVYRKLKIKDLPRILIEAGVTTGTIMIIVSMASSFAWIIARLQIPQFVSEWFLSVTANPWLILLFINVFLLMLGMVLDAVPALIIFTPIFFPLALQVGIDPIHIGVVMVLNLILGLCTPPLGICIFISGTIAKISFERVARAVLPFVAVGVSILFLVSYVPTLVLYFPRLLGFR